MMDFMRAGGFSMWVVLLFGMITLVLAGLFVWRPSHRRVAVLRGLTVATCFAVLSGLSANVAAVMFKVPSRPEWAHSPDIHLIVMTGIGESLTVAILGFTILALAWLMTAVGQRRLVEP